MHTSHRIDLVLGPSPQSNFPSYSVGYRHHLPLHLYHSIPPHIPSDLFTVLTMTPERSVEVYGLAAEYVKQPLIPHVATRTVKGVIPIIEDQADLLALYKTSSVSYDILARRGCR